MVSAIAEVVGSVSFVLTPLETFEESVQMRLNCGILIDIDGWLAVIAVVRVDQPKPGPICAVTRYIAPPEYRPQ